MQRATLAIVAALLSGAALSAGNDQVGVMVSIPAGEFMMGDSVGDGSAEEKPLRKVQIKAFKLGAREVTFDQYDAYVKAVGEAAVKNNTHMNSHFPEDSHWGRGQRPVVNVSWEEAHMYAEWLGKQTGQKFRLPSEAEWEYAARAGTTTNFPWGNQFSSTQAHGASASPLGKTAVVGSYPPNKFGLYDMTGNVNEWVEDCYHENYAGAPTDGSAWTVGATCSGYRVSRGGSWNSDFTSLRVSQRNGINITSRNGGLGFRLAQDE
jgi:formylglycine-generating enzyme required for sulfatase activity